MSTAILEKQELTFEQRYYEVMRRSSLAPEVGRIALAGIERRRYEEITSGLAEALEGRVSTHYTFELVDGKLVAADGQDIETLLVNGLEDAKRMAAEDDFYEDFLPQRARHELYEHRDNVAMALGRLEHNTQIKFSPMTEEKATSAKNNEKLIKGGQKPYFDRAMLRVSHWDGQRLHMFTRSMDNSDIKLLKQTAKEELGYEFEADNSTGVLGESIWRNINDESWKKLADSIAARADKIHEQRNGGVWRQGRTEDQAKDLQLFVESQTQIINSLIKVGEELAGQHSTYESYKKAFDGQMYNHIALLEKRLELGATDEITDVAAASGGAGAMARAEGRVYDMCGNVIGGAEGSASQAAGQTGFESLARLANKEVECPFCKNKVIIPKNDLEKGNLYCTECDTGVDVCTGKKFSKGRKVQKIGKKVMSFFELVAEQLATYEQERKQKELIKKKREQQEKLEKQKQEHEYKLTA